MTLNVPGVAPRQPQTATSSPAGGAEAAPAPSSAIAQSDVALMARADPAARARWSTRFQRGAGNAALRRALDGRGSVVARAPAVPSGTVESAGQTQTVPGMVITAHAAPDAEEPREAAIARAIPSVMDRSRIRLLETRNQMHAATETFRDHATSRIDALDGDPSDYWGFITIAVGSVVAIASVACPPAVAASVAMAGAITSACQQGVQGGFVADAKTANSEAKERAKAAMRGLATGTRDAVDAFSEAACAANGPVHQQAWMLSLTDEAARLQFERGHERDIEALCDRVGVVNPAKLDLFGATVRKLNGDFGAWLGEQSFNSRHTRFHRLLGQHAPGSEEFEERRREMADGRATGDAAAEAATRARGRRPGR